MALRVVVVGEAGVGKTALVSQLLNRDFPEAYAPTSGHALHFPCVVVGERVFRLALGDSEGLGSLPESGEEEWERVGQRGSGLGRPWGLRSGDAYVLVFDLARPASFAAVERMREQLSRRCPVPAQLVVGAKLDLLEAGSPAADQVSDLSRLVRKTWRLPFLQLSAKWNCGVVDVFQHLLSQLDKDLRKAPLPAIAHPRRPSIAPQRPCRLQ